MKSPIVIAIALLAALVGLTAFQLFHELGILDQSHLPGEDQWTYIVAAPKDEELVHTLNQLGNQGWDIVSARRATGGAGDSDSSPAYEMILKHKGAGVRYNSEAAALSPSIHP